MSTDRLNLTAIDLARRARFWTWSRLATEARIGQGTISTIRRRGRTTATVAGKLAAALDLKSDEILLPAEKPRRTRKSA